VNDPTRSLAAQFAVLHNTAFPLNGYGKKNPVNRGGEKSSRMNRVYNKWEKRDE
jgi:hypothetical protein